MGTSIKIGAKPFMNYINAVLMTLTSLNKTSVIIKARGKFTSRAIDIAQVVTKRYLNNSIKIEDISLGSYEFKANNRRSISTIDITLKRN